MTYLNRRFRLKINNWMLESPEYEVTSQGKYEWSSFARDQETEVYRKFGIVIHKNNIMINIGHAYRC